jgi:sugar/nucleoside kinase (ribokinase family)
MLDLLVIGEINPDLILRGNDVAPAFGQAEKLVEDATLVPGSSSVIVACGAARLGLRVGFCGLVGDDLFGRFMLDAMNQRGIDTTGCVVDPSVSTGFSVILARRDGDRAILTYPGSIPLLTADQVDPDLLQATRHVHAGSFFLLDGLRPDLPALFHAARAGGATTSLDTNWDPSGMWDANAILRETDVFLPNEAEAQAISGRVSADAAIEALAGLVPTVAVKRGGAGAVARRGAERAEALPLAVQVVDTVGAGDSFDAGFLAGHLLGYSLHESLQLAVACGSLSTRAAGGTAAQPALEEALAALAARPPRSG